MKIAIIGSGISGLSCAYHLDYDNEVVVYEKNNRLGGHTDTHAIEVMGKKINVDSGFIIFCRDHYPYFSTMLDDLKVRSQPTTMSFGVHNQRQNFIYNATSINTMFCQRRNLLNPKMYRLIFDIIRFNHLAKRWLKSNDEETSIGEYLEKNHYSKVFMEDHFFPILGALWSAPPKIIRRFPIRFLVEFMYSHGLMQIWRRPQWEVISNGSKSYITALQAHVKNTEFRLNCEISNVVRDTDSVLIHSRNHEPERFDAVIFATHANQVTALLQKPSAIELEILDNIPFQRNEVVIHTDESTMPPFKSAWSIWNVHYHCKENEVDTQHYNICYWMNPLQKLDIDTNIFVSLNEKRRIAENKVIQRRIYHHPTYSAESVATRKRLTEINGKNRTYYAGAYWAWGFHEDGARTAAEAVRLLKEQFSP